MAWRHLAGSDSRYQPQILSVKYDLAASVQGSPLMKGLFHDILVLHRSTLNLLSYADRPSPQLSSLAIFLFLHPVNKVSSVGQLLCNLYLNYDSCGVVE
jgi:hypothetical protein